MVKICRGHADLFVGKKKTNEKDIREPAYANSFTKIKGTKSPDGHATIQPKWQNLKKSLKGHATVVGGHATVGRLSNNFFRSFKQIRKILKRVAERSRDGRWTVTRPSADCQALSELLLLPSRLNTAPVCVT